MITLAESLSKQRRFRKLFWGLMVLALFLGVVIVPVEKLGHEPQIKTYFDGFWWSVTTITSVGYGDMVPATIVGKVLGLVLQLTGVLAFGLMVSLVTVALDESKEKYYRRQLNERLEIMEKQLESIQRHESFVIKEQVEKIQENK